MTKENKVVGIAADNYKVNKFKKTLSKKGFEIMDVVKFNEDVQIIQVSCPTKEFQRLSKLIKSIEVLFKNRN